MDARRWYSRWKPGKVTAIAVENGSQVAAGDVLVELDPRETAAERDQQARDLESARAEAARRRVAIMAANEDSPNTPSVGYPEGTSQEIQLRENGVLASDMAQLLSSRASLTAQRGERVATRDRLRSSIAGREKLLALAKEHVDMLEALNRTKSASRAQVIETLQRYETQVTTQIGDQGQLGEVEASLATLDRKLQEITAQFVADQTQRLEDADRRADHTEGELVKAMTRHERTKLAAPISGTVQQLAVTTVGQVVVTGQALMTVVPSDGPIEIEAMIQNQDIGFIEPGQPAVVKIESFPFSRFGTIDGTVVKVSRDAVDEREESQLSDPRLTARPQASTTMTAQQSAGQNLVFPATIGLRRRSISIDGRDVPLSPGMAVTVEIRTGQRRALDYLLSPLREVTSSAGHER
jgi:hemolysin D